jgi:hypothetical protein
MAAKDFKFISPGIFINEVDNSQLPATPAGVGPVVIGRAERGPGLIPTQVNSFSEFVQIFGPPSPGHNGGDMSRYGTTSGPTYGAYAAQAWLRNNSPITFVRLVGKKNSAADSTGPQSLAGWTTTQKDPDIGTSQGGAYGLFVMQSGSATCQTGTLAAIWYVNSGSVALSGTSYSASSTTGELAAATGTGVKLKASSVYFGATAPREFKALVTSLGSTVINAKFNFDSTSENFIRKVFDTNPPLTNTTITATGSGYWLGETFEDEVNNVLSSTGAGTQYGVVLPLYSDGLTLPGSDFRRDFSDPRTGWFIAQDLTNNTGSFDGTSQQKLFRIVAKNTGRWASRNLKISIQDLRASTDPANAYGTFTVAVRSMTDTDNRPKVLEQFNNCNLNPASENYVARKIGDKYLTWDDTQRRYTAFGNYNSNSDYIYIDMDTQVDERLTNAELLPFGVIGPPRFKSFRDTAVPASVTSMVTGGFDYFAGTQFGGAHGGDPYRLVSGSTNPSQVSFEFPKLRLRASASEGNPTDPRDVWFGVDTTFNRAGRASETIGDYTGPKPLGIKQFVSDSSVYTEDSWVFTLDDMMNTDHVTANKNELTGTNVYVSGSRQLLPSTRVARYPKLAYVNTGSYKYVLENGADKFTTVLHGGFDGLDVTESEPFRNTIWTSDLTNPTERTSYTFNSVKVAIDSLRDPENVEFDLAAMPGITNNTLNRNLIDMCENRGDALAIIDLKGGFVPQTENTTAISGRLGSVKSTIDNKKNNLQINSSFGCAYYPWVQIQDIINGALLWAPPSVAALGAMSYGQRTQELWFAPAGFTRGGLSANNAAGLPVVGVRQRLVSKERDKLYEANINPIAQFPAEGIVIFGQKTLQVTPSALDRINVRRLMIFVKRQISRISATLLFDQNVQSTWNRFLGRAEPFLASVQAGLGLTDYRIILDETTTTPDLIDRNIMYAKIFLKPARAIEFIAIDFVITDSGASFED